MTTKGRARSGVTHVDEDAHAHVNDPEIFIGLVGAIGTDLDLVASELKKALGEVNYKTQVIRLSHLLRTISVDPWRSLPDAGPEDVRYQKYMDAGTRLRETVGRGDALAMLALADIQDKREDLSGDKVEPAPRTAYILRSLKHPDEVKSLRSIYGPRFVLVAAYSPHEKRVQALANRIAESRDDFHHRSYRANAEELIQRDESEVGTKLGQKLRTTYPLADVFLDTSNPEFFKSSLSRFVELLFGNLFHTPTQDECGMMHAQVAALRSASLGRQVGAALTTPTGGVIAVGANEVPKAGGGLYWAGDSPDSRDHVLGEDMSDNLRRRLLGDLLKALRVLGWISAEQDYRSIQDLVQLALVAGPDGQPPLMRDLQLMDLLEFGRSVHAELTAITDAANRGVSVAGSFLYTTTFPCHICARHIVSSGIKKVIYI